MTKKKPKRKPATTAEPTDKELSLVPANAPSALPMKVDGLYGLDVVVADFGGPAEFVRACRLSGNEKVAELVRRFEQSTGAFSFQEQCKALEISPEDVLADVVVALYHYHSSLARMVNAVSVVDVMKASVENAKSLSRSSHQDRTLQFKIAGLIKSEPLVNINLPAAAHSPEKLIHEMGEDSDIELENAGPDPQEQGDH